MEEEKTIAFRWRDHWRAVLLAIAVFVWDFAVSIAFQQGYFDSIKGGVCFSLLIIPIIILVILGVCHPEARKRYCLIPKHPIIFTIILLATLATMGGTAMGFYALTHPPDKPDLMQAVAEKVDQLAKVPNLSIHAIINNDSQSSIMLTNDFLEAPASLSAKAWLGCTNYQYGVLIIPVKYKLAITNFSNPDFEEQSMDVEFVVSNETNSGTAPALEFTLMVASEMPINMSSNWTEFGSEPPAHLSSYNWRQMLFPDSEVSAGGVSFSTQGVKAEIAFVYFAAKTTGASAAVDIRVIPYPYFKHDTTPKPFIISSHNFTNKMQFSEALKEHGVL